MVDVTPSRKIYDYYYYYFLPSSQEGKSAPPSFAPAFDTFYQSMIVFTNHSTVDYQASRCSHTVH